MSGLLLKSERLSFHKQPLRLEKLTKQALWSYPIYKLAQTPLCYLYIRGNTIAPTTAVPTPTHPERAKRITANEDVLNSELEPHSRTLCAACIPSKCEIDDWTVSVPS